ncbi:glutathione S-transferase, putative, partial [Ixodes scapularis]
MVQIAGETDLRLLAGTLVDTPLRAVHGQVGTPGIRTDQEGNRLRYRPEGASRKPELKTCGQDAASRCPSVAGLKSCFPAPSGRLLVARPHALLSGATLPGRAEMALHVFIVIRKEDASQGRLRARFSIFRMNPFHKLPTLCDDGFVVFESTAICLYLLNKYAPGSELYPKDVEKRARIDQLMAVVTSCLQPRYHDIYKLYLLLGKKPTAEQLQALEDLALQGLEFMMGSSKFAVGDELTLADLTLVAHLGLVIK